MTGILNLGVASSGILVLLATAAFSHHVSYVLVPVATVSTQDVLPQQQPHNDSDIQQSLRDLGEVMSYLPQCARIDQFNEIKRMLESVGDYLHCNLKSGDMTVTVHAPDIPPLHMLEDAALNKPSYHSSTYQTYTSNYAVDGYDHTLSHTGHDTQPWWMVDLGAEKTIYYIEILPQPPYQRYHDVELRIGNTLQTNGDFSLHTKLNSYKGPYSEEQGNLLHTFCNGITGRYLSLKITSQQKEYLHIKTFKAVVRKE